MIFRIILSPWPGMNAHKIVNLLAEMGFNSIGIMVKPVDGVPIVDSSFFGGKDDGTLTDVLKAARQNEMEVVAKLSVMCDIRLCVERPDLVSFARNSAPLIHPYVDLDWYGFICPTREEVRSRYLKLIEDIVLKYDIDALNLDYVGFAFAEGDGRRILACYCPHCRDEFKAETGKDPIELSQLSDPWVDWRTSKITANLRSFAKAANRNSVRFEICQDQDSTVENRLFNMYRRALGIDLNSVPSLVDHYVPRAAHSGIQLFSRQLKHFRDAHRTRLLPEIPKTAISRPEDMLGFLRGAQFAGCDGLALQGFGSQSQSYRLETLRSISQLVDL